MTAKAKSKTIKEIAKARKAAQDQLHADMDRLADRRLELAEKVGNGGKLTDAEKKEQQTLVDALHKLATVETRTLLFALSELNDSDDVKDLQKQLDAANKELDDTRKHVEDISKSIKKAGDFLKTVTGTLNSISGLLGALVV